MWFRWWHGSVTDPKFAWIARKSGHPVAIVIAVWAALLEHASQESDTGRRGDVSRFDCEAIGVHLGVEEGVAESIVEAMNAKGLIAGGRIAQWEKRQPKREDSSRDRMREYRARQNHHAAGDASSSDVTQGDASENVVTQCDAREDKNRADQSKDKENIFPHSGDTRPSRAQSRITPFLSPDRRFRSGGTNSGHTIRVAWKRKKRVRHLTILLPAFPRRFAVFEWRTSHGV